MASIKTIFTNIANAIREKKGTTTKYLPENMSTEISTIETGIDTSNATATLNDILLDKTAYVNGEKIVGAIPTYNNEHENGYVQISTLKKLLDTRQSAGYLFYYYKGTSVADLISYSDTENVTDMIYMFAGCKNLQSIPQLDTSNVTNMNSMFNGCYKLQSIPQLDTSKVKYMSWMFCDCYLLPKIDLTSMDIASSAWSNSTFNNCYSLTKLIIRTMTNIPVLDSNAFNNAYHFNGIVNATYNPQGLKDGRIYVPDDKVEELKAATNWSAFADIIVPLSTLVE